MDKVFLRADTDDRRTWDKVFANNHYNLADLDGLAVVDVGAHVGAFSCRAVLAGAARVLAIEASPQTYSVLCANTGGHDAVSCRLAALDTHDDGLVGVTGTVEGDAARVATDIARYNSHCYTVPTVSLGSLCGALGGRAVDLLKLDCQGAEWKAFRSTPDTVWECVREVVGELHTDVHVMDFLAFAARALAGTLGAERADWTSRAIGVEAVTMFFGARGFTAEFSFDPDDPHSADFHAYRAGRRTVAAL